MNKYCFQPVLFNSFSTGNSFLKKTYKKLFTLIFFLTILFSFNSFNQVSAQWVNQGNPASGYFKYLFFLNGNAGWGAGNSVFRTTNGGTNWTAYSNPAATNLQAICFINENTGFCGSNGFYRSTNGGVNWQLITNSFGNISQIIFINSLTGWVACHQSGILKTTDGGNNWVDMYSGPFINFESVNFINSNTGWACGWNGAILKTTNAGTNWIAQSSGISSHLNSINFSDVNTGRAAGDGGIFLRTTNGGTNWTSAAGPFTNDYNNLHFINESTGWLSGYNGVGFTTNNGTSWIDQTPSQGQDFYEGLAFIAPGTIYAAAATVWKNTSGGFNLAAPSNLTSAPATTSRINLSWTDNSTDEEKFMIERREGLGVWGLIDSVGAGVTTYQSTGMTSNVEYQFRVYAKRLIFTSGYSNTAIDRPYMEPPAHLSPANGFISASTTPTLSWSTVPGGFFYYLQVASDTSFSNIVYSVNDLGLTSANIPSGILQNSTRYYWRTRVTNLGNESLYSDYWSIVVQDPNYGNNISSANNLYYFANSTPGSDLSPSKPAYNWRDTTGSINMILNRFAQMPMGAGQTDDGRFDILGQLPPGNAIRFFGTNYTNFYVGTNGIIAFAPFAPTGVTQFEPTAPLPQAFIPNAIFGFWKDLNFNDPIININRLCYKITADEVIITYWHAPNYAMSGAEITDYVSFQVIIKHSASPTVNSKIEVMYNYDETGNTFRTKYNNNTLANHLIGIEGANNSSQILQYRYRNTAQEIISSGPMFGSNLALAMGPDQNTLPVELASFTSMVNRNNVQLNWSTISEENNSGFDVERMSNVNGQLSMWSKVGNIQGNGTSTEAKNYYYEDRNIPSGSYKYRLKQIDYNGNFEYHELSSEVIVGVPNKYALSQNYPNPFNPVTKINFEIPSNVNGQLSNVKLYVYDVTGRMITELVNKQMEAGYYTVDFNASNFASGIYFYRLTANDFVQTKKMMLVK